jgi:hypothetical protein
VRNHTPEFGLLLMCHDGKNQDSVVLIYPAPRIGVYSHIAPPVLAESKRSSTMQHTKNAAQAADFMELRVLFSAFDGAGCVLSHRQISLTSRVAAPNGASR